jgi:hypothetical protein
MREVAGGALIVLGVLIPTLHAASKKSANAA